MKIVLFALNASYVHTNLAIRAIAAPLRRAGHAVTLLEFTQKDRRERVLQALYEADAQVYGFSAYIWNVTQLCAFAADLKALRPEARVVFGGPEVGYCAQSFLDAHPFVDHVITGEGEAAFAHLCNGLDTAPAILHGGAYADFETAGILYEAKELSTGQIFYYESSRGCPYRCAYCLSSVPLPHAPKAQKVRAKSVEQTLCDLTAFEVGEQIKVIKFVDRTFNFDRARAKAIWRALSEPRFTKHYHFEICAALLDEESFQILASVPKGKFQLEIGVQSTFAPTLEAVCRPDDTQAVLLALQRLKAAGNLHVHADLIAGLPYEDFERFGRSFDDLFGLCDQLQLGFLKMLQGCSLRNDAAQYGYRFSATPPYEVLENRFLTYPQLCTLKTVAALVERFANSGHFASVFPDLIAAFPSPFACFLAMAQSLPKELTALSQRESYLFLWNFGVSHLPKETHLAFCHRLCFDYLQNETSPLPVQLPSALRPVWIQDDSLRREFLAQCARQGISVCQTALVFARFCHLDGVIAIDRVNHQWYRVDVR